MSRQIQIRRGTSAEHDNFTGAIGEITMDTTNNTLRVHDGSTVGGHILAKKNTTLAGYGITDGVNTALSNLTSAGKKICSNMSMPSNTKESLTIGASGANYVAPADGYFVIRINLNTGGYVSVGMCGTNLTQLINTSHQCGMLVPVAKEQTITVNYSNRIPASYEHITFVYTKGAQ
ncbi:MAG: hypothetical protein II843_01905 [Alphaproteobacteria bacterium]|nr:hypothetical protein [Alphaproteobacteria bacterium]MBQ6012087.1 hypothetical protein [Alphaproteobacteria bacterium]